MDSLGVLILGFLGGLCVGVVIGVSVTFPLAALFLLLVFAAAMLMTLFIDGAGEWLSARLGRKSEGDDAG